MKTAQVGVGRKYGVSAQIWRVGILVAILAITGWAALVAARSYRREAGEFFPPRRPDALPAAAAGLLGLEEIAFRDPEGAVLRGWYAASTNRAGVLLLHGAGRDR